MDPQGPLAKKKKECEAMTKAKREAVQETLQS